MPNTHHHGSCAQGVRPQLSGATEQVGAHRTKSTHPIPIYSAPIMPSSTQYTSSLQMGSWVTSVGTERATEHDCLQLIDLCKLLTEGCAQPPQKIRSGAGQAEKAGWIREAVGEEEVLFSWLVCWVVPQWPPSQASVSVLEGWGEGRNEGGGGKEWREGGRIR